MKDLYGRGLTHEAVRDFRLRLQAVIAPELIRRVEIFVLDPADESAPSAPSSVQ
jgi:hypothetical protein